MTSSNSDLHGNAPDTCPVALLIIDMINDLEFPGGDELFKPALAAAARIADLKKRASQAKIPVVYVNDNFGLWKSDLPFLVRHCLHDDVPGKPIVELLRPDKSDYFVLKPKNSAFFATPLAILLEHLNVKHLILTGLSTDACVQFTAQDAYLRDFRLSIPSDCVAAIAKTHTSSALSYMKRVMSADITPSTELDLQRFL